MHEPGLLYSIPSFLLKVNILILKSGNSEIVCILYPIEQYWSFEYFVYVFVWMLPYVFSYCFNGLHGDVVWDMNVLLGKMFQVCHKLSLYVNDDFILIHSGHFSIS